MEDKVVQRSGISRYNVPFPLTYVFYTNRSLLEVSTNRRRHPPFTKISMGPDLYKWNGHIFYFLRNL